MSANARVVYKNAVDDSRCTLSCSVAVQLALSYVQSYSRRPFRASSSAAFKIKGTYGGAAVRASMVSALRTNLTSDSTWRFRAYSTVDWTGTAVVDTGIVYPIEALSLEELDFGVDPLGEDIWRSFYGQKNAVAWFTEGSTIFLSWEIDIVDTGNPDGYVDIMRLFVGNHFELTINPEYGVQWGWEEGSKLWDTQGGGVRADVSDPWRVGKLDLLHMQEADRARWMDVTRYCGVGRRDFFFSLYPTDANSKLTRDYYGNFIFLPPLPKLTTTMLDRYSSTLNVREA